MVNDIAVQEFVKAIKEEPQDTNKTYNATVSKVDGEGVVWVNIHGSDKETPTSSTSTEVKRGDSVTVNWRNNKLYIGGNYSNPSAGIGTVAPSVNYVNDLIDKDISVASINAATGYIGDLTADNITTENIKATNGYIQYLVADDITAEDISASSGYIKDLQADSITASDISAASGYIKDLESENITAENIIADHETVGSLDANYAHITNGVIDNAKIGHADVNGLNANYAHITSGVIDNAKIGHADVNGLNANYAHINNGVIDNAKIGYADVNGLSANYASISDLNAAKGRISTLEANEAVVNDTLRATNANVEYLKSDWISTDRLVLTGNNKNNYPPVEITESEFNTNKTAYWTKNGDTYTQCTQQSVYDADEQYYVRQTVKSIIEAINTANSSDPQIVVSNDKLIAASMDVAELSAITADMGELTAGKIKKGNNFINLDTSPATMEFKNASTWNSATQGLQFDAQGNLNIKGKVEITSSDTIPTKTEAQGYASTAESNAKGYADGVAATAQKYATAVYGTCTATGASTAAKVVTLADFKLFTGAQITVKFTNANTAAAPTLNVNSTGAKAIYVNEAVTSSSNPLLWAAGAELHFTYDGSYWNCDDVGYGYSTTCAVAATTAAKTGAQTGAIITNGTTVALTCTYANTVEGALTFNFASTGAASIYQHNAITSSSNALVWSAGSTVTFVRRGAYWYYVASTTIDGDNIKTGKIKANLGGSYIDLDSGDMFLGDASTLESSTQGLMWDESAGTLDIKGKVTITSGSNVPTNIEMNSAIGSAVNGIDIGGRNKAALSYIWNRTGSTYTTNGITFTNLGGGRFSAVGTATNIGDIWWCNASGTSTQLGAGGTYTYTIYLESGTMPANIGLQVSEANSGGTWQRNNRSNGGATTYTFSTNTGNHPYHLGFWAVAANTAINITFRLKFEEGNKSTDWTPAPEDVDAQIDGIEIGGKNILRGTNNITIANGFYPKGEWYKSGTGTVTTSVAISDSPLPAFTTAVQLTTTAANTNVGIAQGGVPFHTGEITHSVWVKGTAGDTIRLQPIWAGGTNVPERGDKSFTIADGNWHKYTFTKSVAYNHPIGSSVSTADNTYANAGYVYFKSATVGHSCLVIGDMLEYGNKATDWTPAPEDSLAEEQRIYYRSKVSGTVSKPTEWITENGDKYNATVSVGNSGWSTKVTPIASSVDATSDNRYLYLYTCIQRKNEGGVVSFTDVLLDESTTVIDGGKIITGTVTANQIAANAVTADKITIGAIEEYENILLDSDAPTLTKVKASYNRYFSDGGNNKIVCSNFTLTDAPEQGLKYGRRFTYDGSVATNNYVRSYAFYDNGTNNSIPLVPNQTYTATWWARCTSGSGRTQFYYSKGDGASGAVSGTIYTLTSYWKKYTHSFTFGSALNTNYNRIWFRALFPKSTAGTVEICGCKLTVGDDAESYITRIDSNGIRVHPSSTENNSVVINSNGMEIFKGGASVAYYGDTSRVGEESGAHLDITADSISGISSSGNEYFQITEAGGTSTNWSYIRIDNAGAGYITNTSVGIEFNLATLSQTSTIWDAISSGASFKIKTEYFGMKTAGGDLPVSRYKINTDTFTKGMAGNATYTQYSTPSTATTKAAYPTLPSGWRTFVGKRVYFGYSTTVNLPYYRMGVDTAESGGGSSVAMGTGTIADGDNQLALGKYNAAGSNALVVVGYGSSASNRSNVLTISKSGSVDSASYIYAGDGIISHGDVSSTNGYKSHGHSSAIGTVKKTWLSSAKSVANNTPTALCSLSLEAGVWIVTGLTRAPVNATGLRAMNIATASGHNAYEIVMPAVSGTYTQLHHVRIYEFSSTTTVYLNVIQTSGGALTYPVGSSNGQNALTAVRIQ